MPLLDQVLNREEIKKVIEGKGAARRIPMTIHQWVTTGVFGSREAKYQELLDQYPSDANFILFNIPKIFDSPVDDPSYRWLNFDNPFPERTALDAAGGLDNWAKLDEVLNDFPNPNYPGLIPSLPLKDDGIYRVGRWSYWLFERLWSIRGMENALCDFYEHGDQVHRLFRALTDFYKAIVSRTKKELGLDAIYTTDDIGMQTNPMFSLKIFREFFKPYYRELIVHAHKLNMHFWLHTCGNIELFIPEFIEIGLDVLHPIQKYTMNEKNIAAKYGKDICIWAGMDVQRIIPFGNPEDVRREVRFLYNSYFRRDGRFIITAGNRLTADTPYENLEAFLNESLFYGQKICGS